MYTYNISDYVLMNQRGGIFIGDEKIYNMERTLSFEDKMQFMDDYSDLFFVNEINFSYILSVIEKFIVAEKSNYFKKDGWDIIKGSSLLPWLKKNDPKHFFDQDYRYGNYRLFYYQGNITNGLKLNNLYGKNVSEDFVNEFFHRFLKEMESRERGHYKTHDPVQIKISKIKEYGERFGVLNKETNDIIWNHKTDVLESNVDQYLSLYKSVEDAYYIASTKAKEIEE